MVAKNIIIAHSAPGIRRTLAGELESFADFHVVALTSDLVETFAAVEDHLPQAVIISEDLASCEEFEVMRALFSELDVRWLSIRQPNSANGKNDETSDSREIKADLFVLSGRLDIASIAAQLRQLTRYGLSPANSAKKSCETNRDTGPYERLILIGASTGGVDAVLTVLRAFPADCPPTLIVQHTGRGFGNSLVRLLDRQCEANVVLGERAEVLRRGQVIVAAGLETHLTLTKDRPLRAVPYAGPQLSGHRPSVDALFQSAVSVGSRIVATVLTGMGRDGAQGLCDLRAAGARTFAQDMATSVVYGMPRAAVELGGVEHSLPIDKMGAALLNAARPVTQNQKELRA